MSRHVGPKSSALKSGVARSGFDGSDESKPGGPAAVAQWVWRSGWYYIVDRSCLTNVEQVFVKSSGRARTVLAFQRRYRPTWSVVNPAGGFMRTRLRAPWPDAHSSAPVEFGGEHRPRPVCRHASRYRQASGLLAPARSPPGELARAQFQLPSRRTFRVLSLQRWRCSAAASGVACVQVALSRAEAQCIVHALARSSRPSIIPSLPTMSALLCPAPSARLLHGTGGIRFAKECVRGPSLVFRIKPYRCPRGRGVRPPEERRRPGTKCRRPMVSFVDQEQQHVVSAAA